MNPKALIYIVIFIFIFIIGCKLTIFNNGQYESKNKNVPFNQLIDSKNK